MILSTTPGEPRSPLIVGRFHRVVPLAHRRPGSQGAAVFEGVDECVVVQAHHWRTEFL